MKFFYLKKIFVFITKLNQSKISKKKFKDNKPGEDKKAKVDNDKKYNFKRQKRRQLYQKGHRKIF